MTSPSEMSNYVYGKKYGLGMERFSVESKSFQVRFEGEVGGTRLSMSMHCKGLVFSLGFEEVV